MDICRIFAPNMKRVCILIFSKGGAFMCILNDILQFVQGGVRTLNDAVNGRYCVQTEDVQAMRRELFESRSGRLDDQRALLQDRRKINADIRTSFEKIVLKNG